MLKMVYFGVGKNAVMVLDGSKKLGASDLTKLKGKFSASCGRLYF